MKKKQMNIMEKHVSQVKNRTGKKYHEKASGARARASWPQNQVQQWDPTRPFQ
jgi:hypothetical protein